MKCKLVLACCLALPVFSQAADGYPNKPIKMIVAFPAGGPTDVNARLFAQSMGEQLGQAVIVENKAGAGGNIASAYVAGAAPDGYTIYYNTSSLLLGALLYNSAKHDPIKDFAPVIRTAGVPLAVVSHPNIPAKTLPEFVSFAKKNPGKINYGSSGAGTIDHLAGELLANALGIQVEHVPYKGTAPALIDLSAGRLQMMVTTVNTVRPLVLDKKLTALAIASPARSSALPGVPTVAEAANLANFEITAWQGIVVPAGTPAAVITQLNKAARAALQQKEFKEKLVTSGAEAYGSSPEEYGAYLRSEQRRWKDVIQRANIQLQ